MFCCFGMTTFCYLVVFVFFFKQKTAYEMRISDWSSDVCSSDLPMRSAAAGEAASMSSAPKPMRAISESRVQRSTVHHQRPIRLVSVRTVLLSHAKIGRASCRERVCQYV